MAVVDALGKCKQVVENHQRIIASVSGGSDSDVMLDLIVRCGGKDKTTFVFFSAGLEYEATKKQLDFLREKYDVEIEVVPPIKPIPTCVREHGVPFWNKHVSDMIERLQRHNFQWEDRPYEELIEKHPKCSSALKWWCNLKTDRAKSTSLDIAAVPFLKEFLVENPPKFKISSKCCHYAKKEPSRKFERQLDCDLLCLGIRRSEGGVRSIAHNSCFTQVFAGPNQYRPLFWFSDKDKSTYDEHYGVKHSDCYEVWGMKRTGCAGCPLTKNFEKELGLAEIHEPKFHKAMLKVFGQSYEYRRQFEAFREEQKKEEGCRESRN